MTANSRFQPREFADGQSLIALQSFCNGLSRAEQMYVHQIAACIDELAPGPGNLVYLHATHLGLQLDGLNPVVFSAIDGCTHLQVAQIHLASTVGGVLSFVDFFAKRFPFVIQMIRTVRESPFCAIAGKRGRHDFSAILARRGILNTFVADKASDILYSITSRLLFSNPSESTGGTVSEREQFRALSTFLLYHNNYRPIPWLINNTPLQRLKSFDGYTSLHSFCPMDASDTHREIPWAGQVEFSMQQLSNHDQTVRGPVNSSARRTP
jgi:hypothetical protein